MKPSLALLGGLLVLCVVIASGVEAARRPFIPNFRSRYEQPVKDDASIPPYDSFIFEQNVDHFNFANTDTFDETVLYTTQFATTTESPVIIFYTGNEGPINLFWNNTGFAFTLAETFGAVVIFAEHRYYGDSLPYGFPACFEPENIGYLSVEQALADYANFLNSIKTSGGDYIPGYDFSDSVIISIGGSYGGMLSAWFRLKYPNVVDAALAASAPILLFSGSPSSDPYAFNRIVTQDFEGAAPGSSAVVLQVWDLIASQGNTSEGLQQLATTFKVCGELDAETGVDDLINWIQNGLVYMAMGDYPYPANFLTPMPGFPVNVSAPRLLENSNVLDSVMDALQVYYNWTGEAGSCFNLSVVFTDQLGLAAWNYQACTEVVLPMSSNGVTDFFPAYNWTVEDLAAGCQQEFGSALTPNAYWGQIYGYDSIAGASNIIFSNGELDPWSGGGVVESTSESLPAILIAEGAHHLDLRTPNPQDPESVIVAREKEIAFLQQWVSEATEAKAAARRARA